MNDIEGEAERALAEIGVRHREVARRQPLRQRDPEASELQAVTGTAKRKRLAFDRDAERHRHAESDIFLEPGRTGEALGRMDDLRKAALARADPGPGLTTG